MADTTTTSQPGTPGTTTPQSRRKYSIDLTLELERQLDLEHADVDEAEQTTPVVAAPQKSSLDPQVLAHIIGQLRESIAAQARELETTKEMLATSSSTEAELRDALQFMTDKATALEEELEELRKKSKDDEEAISMLRTKVEESRRGLMRLQTESRRQSMHPPAALDTARANASKRQSFTPLTGTLTGSHRRSPSMGDFPSPTPTAGFDASRRMSGMSLFGRRSPSHLPEQDPLLAEMESMRREMDGLRKQVAALNDELDTARGEVSEANEAREASENCAAALREFIAEHNIGAGPPPPPKEVHTRSESTSSSWGAFGKLWRTEAAPAPAAASPAIVTRKLGGLFSARSSVVSTSTTSSAMSPQLQANAALPPMTQRDSVYSMSDASSVAEPISPTSEAPIAPVAVRDGSAAEGADSHIQEITLDMGKAAPTATTGAVVA
ncbi:hypothetical protein K523DRAFT_417468 [Schizophyllum commune Tattone D]|nr:hypothetical protein K523DRAFT_417468 [Schizophyllum commune Tattone D]